MSIEILEIESLSDDLAARASDYRYENVIPVLRQSRPVAVIRAGEASTACKVSAEKDPGCILVDAGPEVEIEVNVLAQQEDVGYIVVVAHGLTDRLGFEGTSLYMVGKYPGDAVDGKIVHLVACNTAERLGPDMLQHGCLFFFGYKDSFTFGATDDELKVLLDCDAEIDRRLALGEPAGEVEKAVRSKYQQEILKAGTSSVAEALRQNLHALWCDGKHPEARLV